MWVVVFFRQDRAVEMRNYFSFEELNGLQFQADLIGSDRYVIYPLQSGEPVEYVKQSSWIRLNQR